MFGKNVNQDLTRQVNKLTTRQVPNITDDAAVGKSATQISGVVPSGWEERSAASVTQFQGKATTDEQISSRLPEQGFKHDEQLRGQGDKEINKAEFNKLGEGSDNLKQGKQEGLNQPDGGFVLGKEDIQSGEMKGKQEQEGGLKEKEEGLLQSESRGFQEKQGDFQDKPESGLMQGKQEGSFQDKPESGLMQGKEEGSFQDKPESGLMQGKQQGDFQGKPESGLMQGKQEGSFQDKPESGLMQGKEEGLRQPSSQEGKTLHGGFEQGAFQKEGTETQRFEGFRDGDKEFHEGFKGGVLPGQPGFREDVTFQGLRANPVRDTLPHGGGR